MPPRTRTLLLTGLTLLLIALGFTYVHETQPPAITRLLPECDAILYLNLAPLRAATHFDRDPVTRSPSYQQFIDATGIVPERDLATAAFALTRMPNPVGPNGPAGFSEVVTGTFDRPRLERYLLALSSARTETYANQTVYSIPSEDRTLRVAILNAHTLAASNMPTAEQIHHILDASRSQSLVHTPAGPTLLTQRFPELPHFALAWGIGQLALPFASSTGQLTAFGLALPIPADSTLLASLRFSGSLHLRVEAIAPSEPAAERTADALTQLLALTRALQLAQRPKANTDSTRALRDLLDSAQVEQRGTRTALTATLPTPLLRQLTQ